MNVVRICFQASYRDQQGQMRRMDPVLSEPVYDKSESRVLFHLDCLWLRVPESPTYNGMNKQGVLFFFSVIKAVPIASAAQLYLGAGSAAL